MDAGVQHRRRGPPRGRLRGRHRRRRDARGRRAAASTQALGEGWTVEATLRGAELERWSYQRPFELVEFPADPPRTSWCSPTTSPPRTAPGWCTSPPPSAPTTWRSAAPTGCRWSTRSGPTATSPTTSPLVGGQFFKHADTDLVKDLDSRGLLFRHVAYEHSYPHCWRCHTALLYYAQPSWYIRTTAVKDALLRENEQTNWYPETIKWGRYGDWLNNNIDWALSRNRYWGTPLPIWRCAEGHQTCVGSLAELSELTGTDQSELDPHRPFVDDVTFACPDVRCRGDAGCPR